MLLPEQFPYLFISYKQPLALLNQIPEFKLYVCVGCLETLETADCGHFNKYFSGYVARLQRTVSGYCREGIVLRKMNHCRIIHNKRQRAVFSYMGVKGMILLFI